MKTIDKGTLTRTILLVLALANQLLTASGHSVIPIDDATVTNIISTGFTVAIHGGRITTSLMQPKKELNLQKV
ncbi:Phage holin [Lactococcus lactis subsp. lactis]|nr:phage holin [Lactococcus lactis]ARE11609.1 phage holin [Lactococcus lactis subsp. lactis]KSU32908.1 Phage holin [Lactococcus lactis subsp. lactis]URL08318.1 phage holin [Lactococcus lactis subsp. lactis]